MSHTPMCVELKRFRNSRGKWDYKCPWEGCTYESVGADTVAHHYGDVQYVPSLFRLFNELITIFRT